MSTKRKVTYEQDQALCYGRSVARRNQRARVAQKAADAKVAAEREAAARKHAEDHETGWASWGNWEYDFDAMTETRKCRDCAATETRELKL